MSEVVDMFMSEANNSKVYQLRHRLMIIALLLSLVMGSVTVDKTAEAASKSKYNLTSEYNKCWKAYKAKKKTTDAKAKKHVRKVICKQIFVKIDKGTKTLFKKPSNDKQTSNNCFTWKYSFKKDIRRRIGNNSF